MANEQLVDMLDRCMKIIDTKQKDFQELQTKYDNLLIMRDKSSKLYETTLQESMASTNRIKDLTRFILFHKKSINVEHDELVKLLTSQK